MNTFQHWAARNPNKIVLTDVGSGRQFLAHELDQLAHRAARWFLQQQFPAESHVAFLLENRSELIVLALGARLAGLYFTPISTHLSHGDIDYILKDCGARTIIYSDTTAALCPAPELTTGYNLDADPDGLFHPVVPAQASRLEPLPPRPRGRDLIYSSGTTGRPKGIRRPLTPHADKDKPSPEVESIRNNFGITEQTCFLSPGPLYHAAPLRFYLHTLDNGGSGVIMRRFDPELALQTIERYGVTHSQWVPTMFTRLLQLPEPVRRRHALSSMRVAIHAAAPCSIPLKQAMLDWWGDILLEFYGGSEGVGSTIINSMEWRAHKGSVGRALHGSIHILDDDGTELPPHSIGQVFFSGKTPFTYLNDAEKTRSAYNDKGWGTLGDLGHIDAEGYLYLSDRRADLILSGGVNLYPQEIENSLANHAAVADIAVVGIPDADFGETVLAIVVPAPDAGDTEALAQELYSHARLHLGAMKAPRRFAFASELPRLETGKVLRRVLKEQYRSPEHPPWVVVLPTHTVN